MCGICGIFGNSGESTDASIATMNSIQRLRGPDDSGIHEIVADGFRCTLGHSRLAILDRSGGAQPMSHPDSGVTLSFNGEIYNHLLLRSELQNSGHTFRTRSDSEVLLHGYHAWGIQGLLQRIDGMFSFAIADPHTRELFLARDPAGQKPLYYTTNACQQHFAFASTLKALASLPWFDRQIDGTALELFLNLRAIPAPYSIYKMTRKLPPGSYLAFDGQRCVIHEYWSPFSIPLRNEQQREHEQLEEYQRVLESALAETLVADESVSLLLSSGVDSSSLAAAMSTLPGRDAIAAFTVSFSAQGYDESIAAAAIAKKLGLNHRIINFEDEPFSDQLDRMRETIDEPFGDPGILPALQLCKGVAATNRVAISGDGADELFGGYPTFGILPYWRLINRFPRSFRPLCNTLSHLLPLSDRPYSLALKMQRLSQGLGYPDAMAFARWLCIFSPSETAALLPDQGTGAFTSFVTSQLAGAPETDPVSTMCRSYFRLFLPGVLEKMDRASMRYSLETRTPFLQRPMMEFALSLPSRFKVRNGTTKYLMRRSLEQNLPKQFVQATKKGFLPPLSAQFAGSLGSELESVLPDTCDSFGIDRTSIRAMLSEHRTLRSDHSARLWLIYQLALFNQNSRNSTVDAPLLHQEICGVHNR